ncbi:bifunctional aminoglycoside phosphotransferase/ATP-binding protein [Telmatospirillum sp. J64-1]|uniref:bifunctional aminoglycoside phosphotransferase/ATP-binding protein n=1 Tax=Telmatospirillum sp. J64-1 TaxID=2502183 RepID=UPI00115DCE71|nr:bifunctional aminoglycoside phosphotransferase/ATP-binding protein [Telmatospirillum sp. J64-1]
MIPESQRDIVRLLSREDGFGGGALSCQETHISAIFISGDEVLKLKKAVTLPFLDFAPPENRRAACEAELALNRRTAPDLYLGITTVTREADSSLALDGAGEAVEWLVHMRRFDQSTLFDRLAQEGRLDRHLLMDLAEDIARFHRNAQPRPDQGGLSGMAWIIDNNLAASRPFSPSVFPAEALENLAAASQRWLRRLTPLLEERRAEGWVRLCHGDLHLGNICLFQGRPTLFDAIEFSEMIACIDTLYDLAFLLMDLEQRGLRRETSWVLNHYLDVTGDRGALAALPFFLSCRAAIRAHVNAAIAAGEEGEAKAAREKLARDYLDLATRYLHPPTPRLVAAGGLSGSGKSRLAREIAPYLGGKDACGPGAVVIRSDVLRKQLAGIPLDQRLGPEGYTPEMSSRTYDALMTAARKALADGQMVIADAVFARPEEREAIAAVAREAGVPFDGFWLHADPEVAAQRIRKRRRNVSDATPDVLERQLSYDIGPMRWQVIPSSGPKDKTVRTVRASLGI